MIPQQRAIGPKQATADIILFDEMSQAGTRAARQSVEKVWLSMCLGSVVSVSFILAAKHIL